MIYDKQQNYGYKLDKSDVSVIFRDNIDIPIHRWFHYAEGFSSEFVNYYFDKYGIKKGDTVYEPFMGSGTVGVCSKLKEINVIGHEISPLMHFISTTKNNFEQYNLEKIKQLEEKLTFSNDIYIKPPDFLKNEKHFTPELLNEILKIKQAVWELEDEKEKDIFKLSFANVLLKSSNAKRVPSFGYKTKKNLDTNLPYEEFYSSLEKIKNDIKTYQNLKLGSVIITKNDSREKFFENNSANIAITSPPYANGIDYVTDYQLEMGWLDLVDQDEKKNIRDLMITYDKTRTRILSEFYEKNEFYKEERLLNLVEELKVLGENYWKKDIHLVILKYFDDMYKVFKNTYDILKKDGRFILVVGDSLFGNVYVPADTLLVIMGEKIGFQLEKFEIARTRYSGQNRSYKLRETIIILKK